MSDSAFNLGIISAKKGEDVKSNPFKDQSQKWKWWNDGFAAAHSQKYVNQDGLLLKHKTIYEEVDESGV